MTKLSRNTQNISYISQRGWQMAYFVSKGLDLYFILAIASLFGLSHLMDAIAIII